MKEMSGEGGPLSARWGFVQDMKGPGPPRPLCPCHSYIRQPEESHVDKKGSQRKGGVDWQYIGRSILLSDQSTPPCCPRLLACLLVGCVGSQARPAPSVSRTAFVKMCNRQCWSHSILEGRVNRFKTLAAYATFFRFNIYEPRNTGSCLNRHSPSLFHPSSPPLSHSPQSSRDKKVDPCHLDSTHSLQNPAAAQK